MLGAYPERSASWINAARENVPMLFTAGRSPLTEEGMAKARKQKGSE